MDNWNQLNDFQSYSGVEGTVQGGNPVPQRPKAMFPNTAYCLEKIFLSMQIMLCSLIGALIAAVIGAFGGTAGLAFLLILSFAIAIASIVAFVNELMGLNRGREEFDGYNWAFWLIVINLIASIIFTFITENEIVSDCLGLLTAIASLMTLTTTIKACRLIKRDDIADIGNKVLVMWAVTFVLSFVLTIAGTLIKASDNLSTGMAVGVGVIAVVAAVLSILQYVFLYKFYMKARDAFNR